MIARTLLLSVLAVLLFATPTLGQSGFGPVPAESPMVIRPDGTAVEPIVPMLDQQPFISPEGIRANPLELIAGAGSVLPGAQRTSAEDAGGLSTPVTVIILLTVISLAPSIMLMTTCFVRILIVLGLVRQAIGTQTLPPPQVITGLSLFMTLMVMTPTIDRIYEEAITPYNNGEIRDYGTLWDRGKQPVRDFMFDQIRATGNWSSLYMVLNYRGIDTSDPASISEDDVDLISLVPAYMLSELRTAFLIGFRVYLPFLVIDMVIASLLISMGMMMLPPVLISLPFKLLLFVLVDGWQLIVGSLMTSFQTGNPVPAPTPADPRTSMLLEQAPELLRFFSSA